MNFKATQSENIAHCQKIDGLREDSLSLRLEFISNLEAIRNENVTQRLDTAAKRKNLSLLPDISATEINRSLTGILREIMERDGLKNIRLEKILSEKVAALEKVLPEGRDNLATTHAAAAATAPNDFPSTLSGGGRTTVPIISVDPSSISSFVGNPSMGTINPQPTDVDGDNKMTSKKRRLDNNGDGGNKMTAAEKAKNYRNKEKGEY
jgi:hypothetical protein